MKKEDYRNSVLHQVRDLKELARIQKEKCFHLEKLTEVMGRETAAGITPQRVLGNWVPWLSL